MKRIIITLVISTLLSANLRAEVGFQFKRGIHYSANKNGDSCYKKGSTFGVRNDRDVMKSRIFASKKNSRNENGGIINDLPIPVLGLCQTNREAPEDSLTIPQSAIISDEEIKQAMEFGTKEKMASIIFGAYIGSVLGAGIGGTLSGEKGLNALPGIFYGGGIGIILGSVINYSIIYNLAKRDAKNRIIKLRSQKKTMGHLPLEMEFTIHSLQPIFKKPHKNNESWTVFSLKIYL